MKVVFDTNVFVAALTLPGGRGDQAMRRIVEGEDSLALSKPILSAPVGTPEGRRLRKRAGWLVATGGLEPPTSAL